MLDDESAHQLVRLAERDGCLNYTAEAVERILELTARHPYFTQLTCQLLFDRAYAIKTDDIPTIDVPDTEAVISKVLEAGENIFEWIWDGLPPAERVIFSAIAAATADRPVIAEEELIGILQRHGIRILIRELELAPKTLIEWEMLRQTDGGYSFFIPLMRRWVAERKPLPKVKDELDRVNPIADQQYQLGHTYYRLGKPQEAVGSLRSALQVNPNHLKARLLLGETLREQGSVDEAVRELEEAYRYDDDAARYPLVRALLAQGDAAEKIGREEDAIPIYTHVLEISPREAVARDRRQAILITRADKAFEAGDLDAAEAVYRQAGADSKVLSVLAYQRKRAVEKSAVEAEALCRQEEWDRAAEIYQRLIELDPEDKRWPEGMELVERERGIARRYAEALGAMQQSKWSEAQRALADVVYSRPDYKDAAQRLAGVTQKLKTEPRTATAEIPVAGVAATLNDTPSVLSSATGARTRWTPRALLDDLPSHATAPPKGLSRGLLWLRWLLAGLFGWPIMCFFALNTTNEESWAAWWLVMGAITGGLQWLVLRRYIDEKGWWVLATAISWLPGALFVLTQNPQAWGYYSAHFDASIRAGSALVAVFVTMIVSPIFQWPVLRRHVGRAGLWVVTGIVSSVGIVLVGYNSNSYVVSGFFMSAAYGAITGAVLFRLPKREVP